MELFDALVRKTRVYRELLEARKTAIDDRNRWYKMAQDDNQSNLALLSQVEQAREENKKLKEHLTTYFVPVELHSKIVGTAENLKFINESNERFIATLEQKIYDLEHPVKLTTGSTFTDSDSFAVFGSGENLPKKSRKKATKKPAPAKKAKPLRARRGAQRSRVSMMTDAQRLADIRKRSDEAWRIHDAPPFDPKTGEPKPFRIISKADEDVKFLLTKLTDAENEIAHLEELLEWEQDAKDDVPEDEE